MTRVLIAEDDAVQRRLVVRWLEMWEYEPVPAGTGADALSALEDPELELAIIDWFLPDLEGPQICEAVRDRAQPVFCILLTTNDDPEAAAIALKAGANDFLRKPCLPNELRGRLRAAERMIGLQHRLASAQKLEAVGHLAAGLAHEVNTPIQFVTGNLDFLRDGFDDLLTALKDWKEAASALPEDTRAPFRPLLENTEVEYLTEEIPTALGEASEGLARVATIIRGLKSFAGPETQTSTDGADVNQVVRDSVEMAGASRRDQVEIELDLGNELPHIAGSRTDLGQIVFNLVVNAVQAAVETRDQSDTRESGAAPAKGSVFIRTHQEADQVVVEVTDDGPGIPAEVRARIFDPFFTTRAVGEGTGQGLTIAQKLVTERLRGSIDFETKDGEGTTFVVRVPATASKDAEDSGVSEGKAA